MITTLKNNNIQKGKRKRIYDHKDVSRSGIYGSMLDHKKMKGHEFADFQKEQFLKRKLERNRRLKMQLVVFFLTVGIIMLFLWGWELIDFSVLKSPKFK